MRASRSLALLVALWLLAWMTGTASAVVDISGPWILDYPHGKGMVILTNAGGTPPTYIGQATIPLPSGKSLTFNVTMLTGPTYVEAGNNVMFKNTTGAGVDVVVMNFSGPSNGVAWIIPSAGEQPPDLLAIHNMKVPAHR